MQKNMLICFPPNQHQVGGFAGLCLGFSFASFSEIIYWLIRIFLPCKRNAKVEPAD